VVIAVHTAWGGKWSGEKSFRIEKELGGSGGNVWTLFQNGMPALASWLDWFPGVDPMKPSYLMHEGCVNIEDSDCSRLQVVLWADKGNKSQGSVVTLTTSRKERRKGGREEGRKGGREEGRKGGREEGRKISVQMNCTKVGGIDEKCCGPKQ
jgi:hypothetical protein